MIAVIQRVSRASVAVAGTQVASIERGLLVLLGVESSDTEEDARALAAKIGAIRVFPGRRPMDRDVSEVGGALLIVSQFTLAASLEKGRRPGFGRAAPPEEARGLYERFVHHAQAVGVPVQCGQFGADMEVSLLNDGPVTYLLRSQDGQVRMP